jgi:hypothetical protein
MKGNCRLNRKVLRVCSAHQTPRVMTRYLPSVLLLILCFVFRTATAQHEIEDRFVGLRVELPADWTNTTETMLGDRRAPFYLVLNRDDGRTKALHSEQSFFASTFKSLALTSSPEAQHSLLGDLVRIMEDVKDFMRHLVGLDSA